MMDATVSFGVVSSAMIPVVSAHVGGEFRLFDVGFVDHGLAESSLLEPTSLTSGKDSG